MADGILTVGPDAVQKIVFPFMSTGGKRGEVRTDQYTFDPGRPELNSQNGGTIFNDLFHDLDTPFI